MFHGGDQPFVPPYNNEPVTAQYFEVKREYMAHHVMLHNNTVVGGDYSVLNRDGVSHVPLQNVTTGGDYSVLKRKEREVT